MPFTKLFPSADPGGSAAGARPDPAPCSRGEALAANPSYDEWIRDHRRMILDRLRAADEAEAICRAARADAERIAVACGMRADDFSGESAGKRAQIVEGFEDDWADPRNGQRGE